MALFSKQISPVKESKAYKTEENAVKAAQKVLEGSGPETQFVIIRNEDDRWSPMIITPSINCVNYAHQGFATLGR